MRLVLICFIALLTLAAPAAAQEQRIVDLQRATPVSEYGGWLLFSRWDGSAFRLSTWHDGDVRDLPVPPQSEPFDADAGPDSAGRPSAAVSICDASCDLFVIGFEPGDELRPVRNANTSGNDEVAPSVWRGRLVFGRRYGRDQLIPYTKRLAAPRSRPSDRLAGLPERRCGAVDPPECRRIEDVRLPHMDLWGRWVAQSWTYQPDGFGGFRQNEIRLTNIRRTDTRQVSYMGTGIGGQTFHGPAIAEGRVAYFKACEADRGGCHPRNSGAFRYRISSGDYQMVGAREGWSAWTWSGAAAYRVPSAFDCGGGDPGSPPSEPCGVYRRLGLDWEPTNQSG
jgi:hypothetical protein